MAEENYIILCLYVKSLWSVLAADSTDLKLSFLSRISNLNGPSLCIVNNTLIQQGRITSIYEVFASEPGGSIDVIALRY